MGASVLEVLDAVACGSDAAVPSAPAARVIRIGLLGFGRVGQAVARVAAAEQDALAAAGVRIECTAALVRDARRARPDAPATPLVTDAQGVFESGVDVIVEALGGVEPARSLVARALHAGIPVVTANKSLVAAHGQELRALAARRGTPLLCEAAALAGVPVLGALSRRPLLASLTALAGILNGTTHFILGEIARGASFDAALARAVALGFAEPDSAADVSGRDAAEKLTLLLHLAGYFDARVESITRLGIDAVTAADVSAAEHLDGTIKPVVLASLQADAGGAWVGPAFVADSHPFARLTGVTNALSLWGARGREAHFTGPGAGPDVTAATVLDDVVEAAGAVRASAGQHADGIAVRAKRRAALETPAPSSWFVRLAGASELGPRDVAEFLALHGTPALRLARHGDSLAALTSRASWDAVQEVAGAFEAWGTRPLVIPAIGIEDAGA